MAVLLPALRLTRSDAVAQFRQSPLDLAKKYKHMDVASLLQKHVAM